MNIDNVEPLTKYNIKVVPFNNVGDGPSSKAVSVETPGSQSI